MGNDPFVVAAESASLPLPGTGKRERGEKMQPLQRFTSHVGTSSLPYNLEKANCCTFCRPLSDIIELPPFTAPHSNVAPGSVTSALAHCAATAGVARPPLCLYKIFPISPFFIVRIRMRWMLSSSSLGIFLPTADLFA